LKTSGISKYIEKTGNIIKSYWSAGHKAIKDSSPEYYKIVVDTCTPYIKLANDLYLVMRNISIKLYNNFATCFEKNLPIALNTVSKNFDNLTSYLMYYKINIISFWYRSSIMLQD